HARLMVYEFFFSSRRRHTRSKRDWSSDVCSSDLRSGGFVVNLKWGSNVDGDAGWSDRPYRSPGGIYRRLDRHVGHSPQGHQGGRSEERRVGKGRRYGWARAQDQKVRRVKEKHIGG